MTVARDLLVGRHLIDEWLHGGCGSQDETGALVSLLESVLGDDLTAAKLLLVMRSLLNCQVAMLELTGHSSDAGWARLYMQLADLA
jgi:hypothetical protein